MKNSVILKRIGLGIAGLVAVFALTMGVADADFTGPANTGGVGNGAIASNAANNVTVGTSTVPASTKLSVYASSTSASHYALQVFQPNSASIFYVRNDGAVSIPGVLSAGTFAGTMAAPNISAGTFGANVGNGTFIFPVSVGIATTTPAYPLSVYGIIQSSSGGFRFPDGTTQTTAATATSTLAAPNVSSGAFGANTGGGNYTFPANVSVGTTTTGYPLIIDQTGGSRAEFLNSSGLRLTAQASGVTGPSIQLYKTGSGSLCCGIIRTETSGGLNELRVQSLYGSVTLMASSSPNTTLSIQPSGNVYIGSPADTYKLQVSGTIFSSSGGFRFPDGTTQTTAAGGATIPAPNVSSGAFGANTGGGNYTFPANLGVASTTSPLTNLTIFQGATANQRGIMLTGSNFNTATVTNGVVLQYGCCGSSNNTQLWITNYADLGNSSKNSFRYTVGYDIPNVGAVKNDNSANMNLSIGNSVSKVGIGYDVHTGAVQADIASMLSVKGNLSVGGTYSNTAAPSNGAIIQGNVGIGTTTATYKLDVASGGSTTARIGTDGSDVLTVGNGTGKINVGTVDPIYQINGEKFATYMAGMIGVKEEVAGSMAIDCDNGRCERTIDFSEEPKGSDLWLFGKVTDIDKHLGQASILLTPSFDGRVSYRKGKGTVTLIANPFTPQDTVEVSYRFTAPRFDADKWSNRTDDEAAGFIIND